MAIAVSDPVNALSHIRAWIFDLDNTLYPADCHLFGQIDARMTAFVSKKLDLPPDEARKIQKQYYVEFGTTLAGLMHKHGQAPVEFLDYVHDIDLSPVKPCSHLRAGLEALPGKRYIFTNGSVKHATNVAEKLQVLDLFDGIFDIAHADFQPKPQPEVYRKFTDHFAITPARAIMFEDIPQNLEAAHAMGVKTVLVQSQAEWFEDEPPEKRPARHGERYPHVDYITDDLAGFLHQTQTALTP